MDEIEYKTAYKEFISLPCIYEKSILSCRISCIKSSKKNLAERESICCLDENAYNICKSWISLLRKKAQFSLQLKEPGNTESVFPHAKEMKVQVGGITGLSQLLDKKREPILPRDHSQLADVYSILNQCIHQYENFEELPFDEIMKSVARFRLR